MCHMIEIMGKKKSITTPQHHQCGCPEWCLRNATVLNTEQVERQHVFVCDEMKFKLQSPDERKKNVYCKSENATFINQ